MTASKKFFVKNWFTISLICLFLFSFSLRFYSYENRWGLALDQAHSALIARYALDSGEIPLVGPFSSAGPMQTGGEWYYFVMLGTIFNQNEVITPWIFLTLTYCLYAVLIALLGKELISKKFGILLGTLATVSTAQIAQGVNLTNQSPLALFSLFAIWSMVRFLKTKKLKYLFLLGFNVSFAITLHFQGVALLSLVIATIIIERVSFRGILATLSGLFVPMIPLLVFDLKNDFINSRNIIQYYLHDQYKISLDVLGRRWKTYAGIFWPNAWSHVIGGHLILGYVLIATLGLVTIYNFLKRNISKEWQIIITSFIAMVILVRYVRTPLYDSYVVFLHPFIFLLTGWVIYFLYQKNKIIAFSLFVLIVMFSLFKDKAELTYSKANSSAISANSQVKLLKEKFPNQKFSIYSYKYQLSSENFILSLFLDAENLIDQKGRRVGLVIATESALTTFPAVKGEIPSQRLLDLNSSSSAQLLGSDFANVNPEQIYKMTQQWYTK